MNNKGLFKVTHAGFVPHDRRGRDLHAKLLARDDGKPVFFTVRTARNPEFSAMAHVVFNKLADGLGVPMEAIKNYLKERTGRYDVVQMPNGKLVKLRHSVSFSAMTEDQFRDFWNDCLPIILEEMLGGVRSKDYQEIVDIIEGRQHAR